ncbi:hypothetical protein GA0070562_3146 [Micromonospora tulbaghiae]|uniref:Uncharacterized protein n=1 Tax=Micromonospora tulbaghiae TaxID=479978 RepID=A0ABY0KKB3_9ACTN|nr:hypothetical protein GA0070562_3146 [Micromonospora tulbaghiae]
MGRGPPGGYEAAIPAPSGAIARTLLGTWPVRGPAAVGEGVARRPGVPPAGVRRAARGRG